MTCRFMDHTVERKITVCAAERWALFQEADYVFDDGNGGRQWN